MKPKKSVHNWTKEDQTLAYFHVLYGVENLCITSEEEIARYVIGTSAKSFGMNCSNFRYILDLDGGQLEHASDLQFDIAAEYSRKSFSEMRQICNEIIVSSDYKEVISEINFAQTKKMQVIWKRESEERLQLELNRYRIHGRKLTKNKI